MDVAVYNTTSENFISKDGHCTFKEDVPKNNTKPEGLFEVTLNRFGIWPSPNKISTRASLPPTPEAETGLPLYSPEGCRYVYCSQGGHNL